MPCIAYSHDLRENHIEVVERKGFGHPDTIADHLAEYLSREYSVYCQKHFGAVLHHNFDKLSLLGGSAHVEFGKGFLTQPIRVIVNGRATRKFGNMEVPLEELITKWVETFFSARLPLISVKKDLRIIFEVSTQSSPGKIDTADGDRGSRSRWFSPSSLKDLPELQRLHSNDTSAGVGYAPLSLLEYCVLKLERSLNHSFVKRHAWVGGDIKVMGIRNGDTYEFTLCVPQIASRVKDIVTYIDNKRIVMCYVMGTLRKLGLDDPKISLNTRDREDIPEVYLTATGTSLESGDEGIVGRGNRINGLITLQNAMGMEGASGKNPVYHIGKLYNLCAQRIANKLSARLDHKVEVSIVSQSGRDLLDPWFISVRTKKAFSSAERATADAIVRMELKAIPKITDWLLDEARELA